MKKKIDKKKIARKLLTVEERAKGVSPYLSKGWAQRHLAIHDRVFRDQRDAHARAVHRRKLKSKLAKV